MGSAFLHRSVRRDGGVGLAGVFGAGGEVDAAAQAALDLVRVPAAGKRRRGRPRLPKAVRYKKPMARQFS